MTSDPNLNPFAPPTTPSNTVDDSLSTFAGKPLILQTAWALAVVINLPIPLMLGHSVTNAGLPRIGMPVGIALVYFFGVWCCTQRPGLMWRLIFGSGFTAVTQFWPIAHMLIGAAAVGVSKFVFDPETGGQNMDRISAVLSATLLTGSGLIFPSLIVGVSVFAVFRITSFDTRF